MPIPSNRDDMARYHRFVPESTPGDRRGHGPSHALARVGFRRRSRLRVPLPGRGPPRVHLRRSSSWSSCHGPTCPAARCTRPKTGRWLRCGYLQIRRCRPSATSSPICASSLASGATARRVVWPCSCSDCVRHGALLPRHDRRRPDVSAPRARHSAHAARPRTLRRVTSRRLPRILDRGEHPLLRPTRLPGDPGDSGAARRSEALAHVA